MQVARQGGVSLEPFTLLSAAHRTALERAMMELSGLRPGQFAGNSWGFPVVPIPEVRDTDTTIRMAPANVDPRFLGHPIYWIHPELTVILPGESSDSWSLRMFYLIMGFGMWTPDRHWVDHLRVNGCRPSEEDVHTYHLPGNPPCVLDQVPLLSVEQLQVPLEVVQQGYEIASRRCSTQLRNQAGIFWQNQHAAAASAATVLGPAAQPVVATAQDDGTWWQQQVVPRFGQLSAAYDDAVGSDAPVSLIIPRLHALLEQISAQLVQIEDIVVILSVPVLRGSGTEAGQYGQATAYLSEASRLSELRRDGYDLYPLAEKCATRREVGSVDRVVGHVYQVYDKTWRRLRLALFNYTRVRTGQEPHPTYAALELDTVGHARAIEATPEQMSEIEFRDHLFRVLDEE